MIKGNKQPRALVCFRWASCWAAIAVCAACVEDLPFNPDEAVLPVVNCLLSNDTVQHLSLTKSVSIGSSYFFKEIREATITLSAGDSVVGQFERKGYDDWQLQYTPLPDIAYTLTVDLPGEPALRATTTMPVANRIVDDRQRNVYPSKFFYQYSAPHACWAYVLYPPDLPDGILRPSGNERLNLLAGTDHPHVDRFNEDGLLTTLIREATTPAYRYYIRIPALPSITGSIPFCLQATYEDFSFVVFRTASEEYDRYLKTSLQKMFLYIDETDPGTWFDESRIYSNIQNGIGIFAAYNDQYFFYIN
jgi:hypothetical protein